MQLVKVGIGVVDMEQVRAILPGADGKTVTIVFVDNERLLINSDNPKETIESLVPAALSAKRY